MHLYVCMCMYMYIYIIQWDFCIFVVWNDLKKQNKLRQTKSRRNCGNFSKTLQETFLQSFLKNYAQVPKTFNSTLALQVGFLKRLGDVATVLLDLVCLSCLHVIPDRLDDDQIRSLCGALAVIRQKSHWIITITCKMNVWKCKLIFPTDTLQQKIEITDLKPFFVDENTNGLRLLHCSVPLIMNKSINLFTKLKIWHQSFEQ